MWKTANTTFCSCLENSTIDLFSLSHSNNGLCKTECSGQYCGIDNAASSLQGVAVFDNARFPCIYSSCEEAFMKTTCPPNSSQIVDLIFPDFSQPLQVKKILVDIKDIIEQSIQAMITLAIIDSVYALSLPKICNSD